MVKLFWSEKHKKSFGMNKNEKKTAWNEFFFEKANYFIKKTSKFLIKRLFFSNSPPHGEKKRHHSRGENINCTLKILLNKS